MRLKKLSLVVLGYIGFTITAYANEVMLTANQPMDITFQVAHQNQGERPVLGKLQSVTVNKNVSVPINLEHYDLAGLVIVSAGGHELPPSANHFNQPEQCSMATDKTKPMGTLEFTLATHKISCSAHGGIFG